MRYRSLDGMGRGALVRALDAEDQLRPIDALLLAGGRERRRLRLAPRALRGARPPIDPSTPASEAVKALQERSPGPRTI